MANANTKRRKLLWTNPKKRKNGYKGEYRWIRGQRYLCLVKWIKTRDGKHLKDSFKYESHEAAVECNWRKSA